MKRGEKLEKIIEMNHIYKSFEHVRAVQDCSFDLYEGEVHSLIGENGAGKSTMMKMLYGLYERDEGSIIVNGQKVPRHYNTFDAIDMEIGMIHQEFMLTKEMTVLENIIVGSEPRKKRIMVDWDAAVEKINYYINTYHMNIQLDKRVGNISVGEAQLVEIVKTLYRGARILILDEPTAVLTPLESDGLFEIIEMMRHDGKSIIFISHKLKEVMQISDRITVMRGGKHISTVRREETSMSELGEVLAGFEKPEAGEIWIENTNVTGFSPKKLRETGLTHIPEDRNIRGLNKALDIKNNLAAYEIDQEPYARHGFLSRHGIRQRVEERIKKYDIRPAVGDAMVASLSGGNAQKVIVGRELDLDGKVLLANQPTRGVDIGSIESIRRLIVSATDSGAAVLLISADLDEILSLSDRIIVLYEGRIAGELINDGYVDEVELGLMMTGGKKDD